MFKDKIPSGNKQLFSGNIGTFTSLHRVAKDYRTGDFKKKEITTHPEMFVKPDSKLGKWFGTETLLGDILKDSKDVLS